ncbi:DEAD/DEAH box helicase [Methanococcoides burtonii]|uniref:Dead box RNA helicase n=2 Tax=Methanococcoides burtonii TaxID=29291 RepID=Q12UP5_METBU|nr:DEAD/DEAH box helicase [Methanococcoides burtonii]AAF89099.1 DEAD-box RNA helicase [Methanococcoides burtonii]ABE52831.1 Dead box RNA helicase [Methanococcoides burtonii DSM 6242]
MESFKKLGIEDAILRSIEDKKFEEPTEIQKMAIPLILEGKDIIGGAATGSGKTLAFGCGIIQKIEKGNGIRALVLTPTRELAEQVQNSLKEFSRHKQLRVAPIYGGVAINPQIRQLERADVVVATPGRLLDHIERGTIDLGDVEILVLDEADRMLDMGFIDDVEEIIDECPSDRQTMMFSATVSKDIQYLSSKYMNNPSKVFAKAYVDSDKLKQVYIDVPKKMKFSLLVHLLKSEKSGLVMVFCNTRSNVDFVQKNLRKNDIDAIAIHGGHTQAKRKSTLSKFHSSNAHALVCTDVAARGLDIPHVSHVYNFDIPDDPSEYVHRIGRTARAGREGKVINVVADVDKGGFTRLSKMHRNFKIEREDLPEFERVLIKSEDSGGRPTRGRREDRKGGRREDRKSAYGGRSSGGSSGGRSSDRSSGGSSGGRSSDRSSGGSSGGRSSDRSSGGSSGGRSSDRSSGGSSGGRSSDRSSGGSSGGRSSDRSSGGSSGGRSSDRSSGGSSGDKARTGFKKRTGVQRKRE